MGALLDHVRSYYGALNSGDPDRVAEGQWSIEDAIEDGERVVIEWMMAWRHPESGERRLNRGTEFGDGRGHMVL